MEKNSTFISTPVAVLLGSAIIAVSILISGGVIRLKGQLPKTTTQTSGTTEKTTADSGKSQEDKLTDLAAQLSLDTSKFKSCLTSEKYKDQVNKDISDADAIGPTGTPTFYIGKANSSGTIDGYLIEGAYPYSRFQEVIDAVATGSAVPKDPSSKEDPKSVKVAEANGAVEGNKNAPVTMIEFSDYECPFCKRHFVQTFPSLKKDYIDSGKVKLVYRNLIAVPSHNPAAMREAIAALCAKEQGGDTVYFKYHDLVYSKTSSNGQGI